ncbi:cytosolic,Branched-chain-amino-acid aminotransferase [Trichinella spiralis]|uniref:Cytosolic,Branched-chain-amino-acid aminotransferase n=1 Tax=Trichinella spiralis TaxID=6334 RepID=A0ABR3KZW4_TRISP
MSIPWAYTKIGTIQRRLAWPLRKDDTQIREAFQIFSNSMMETFPNCLLAIMNFAREKYCPRLFVLGERVFTFTETTESS